MSLRCFQARLSKLAAPPCCRQRLTCSKSFHRAWPPRRRSVLPLNVHNRPTSTRREPPKGGLRLDCSRRLISCHFLELSNRAAGLSSSLLSASPRPRVSSHSSAFLVVARL